MKFLSALRLPQISAPASPPSGENLLYPKSNNKWYSKNSAGVEVLIGPSVGDTLTGGPASETTDANGQTTVTHGMGVTPTAVVVVRTGTGGNITYEPRVASKTSTTFSVQWRRSDNNALAGSGATFTFDWIAM